MSVLLQRTPQAIEDLDAIGWTIAEDNRDAAERVETEILATGHQRMGTRRQDVTTLPVRFWTITKFPNDVIVHRPETNPLQGVAVLHGKRDLQELIEERS